MPIAPPATSVAGVTPIAGSVTAMAAAIIALRSAAGDVLLTRADRQRYKTPIYNLTTGQPLPDVKGEGNLAFHFDNSAFPPCSPTTN